MWWKDERDRKKREKVEGESDRCDRKGRERQEENWVQMTCKRKLWMIPSWGFSKEMVSDWKEFTILNKIVMA